MRLQKILTRIACYCGLLLLGSAVVWGCVNFIGGGVQPGQPVIRLGPETSVVNGPLDDNGDVDYLAVVNDRLAEGVTPENNAFVMLLGVLGPNPEGCRLSDEFYRRLEMKRLPKDGDYFQYPTKKWLARKSTAIQDSAAATSLQGDASAAEHCLWSKADLPLLDLWLNDMEGPLNRVREATLRERFYHPLCSDQSELRVISSLLPGIQCQRGLARALACRSMRSLELGELEECTQDILAMYRLGSLVRQGNTFVEQLVGIAVTGIADERVATVAMSGKFSQHQLCDFRDQIRSQPRVHRFHKCVRDCEQFMNLEAIVSAGRGNIDLYKLITDTSFSYVSNPTPPSPAMESLYRSFDWNVAAKTLNEWAVRLADAWAIEDHQQRTLALGEVDAELTDLNREFRSVGGMAWGIVGGRGTKGAWLGKALIGNLSPISKQLNEAVIRAELKTSQAILLLELAAFKNAHGKFPAQLNELVPEYADQIPTDIDHTQFFYVLTEDGLELSSNGPPGSTLNIEAIRWKDYVAEPQSKAANGN